jgi:hypothetical protein
VLPGVALLLAQQHALTGDFFGSTQLAYYAASDAPAGCFRYGFGEGVGCHFEHGDYVSRYLPNGYGIAEALRNFTVRLSLFATDATNAAPLTLLGGYALVRHRRSPLALLGVGILLQALAYVPFYFDGNYPGGGARFLCEAIPFCQILVARAALDLRVGWLAPPVALAGFALYARHGHEELRERQGGRPMYEPAVVAQAGLKRGLLLVTTDHAFNLGHDPRVQSAQTGLVVARARDDAHDRELYERLGRPPTYRYAFDFSGRSPASIRPYEPPPAPRLEAEAEWPAPHLKGSAYPIHFPCASAGRALRLTQGASASFLAGWTAGSEGLRVGWLATSAAETRLLVGWAGSPKTEISAKGPGCITSQLPFAPPTRATRLEVQLLEGEGALDFLERGSAAAPPPPAPVTR